MLASRCVLLGPRLSSSILAHAARSGRSSTTTRPFTSSSAVLEDPHRHWSGLQTWRESPLNENRTWGPSGPIQPQIPFTDAPISSASSLAEFGTLVLSTSDPLTKSRISHIAFSRLRLGDLPVGVATSPDRPARPTRPALVLSLSYSFLFLSLELDGCRFDGSLGMQVSPKEIPAQNKSGLPLNAYMLHNLAHVELNSIDLAWDTVVRFSPHRDALGEEFFFDFARVADDESRHFAWCSQRLTELGFR